MYTIIVQTAGQRDETIRFPRDTTPQEIIDAATFYSARNNSTFARVYCNGGYVGAGVWGAFTALEGTYLHDYTHTTQLTLGS